MKRNHLNICHSFFREIGIHLSCKVDIRKFALLVDGPSDILLILALVVIEIHFGILMGQARNVDDSSLFSSLDLIQKHSGEQKVADMVDAILPFVALFGNLTLWKGHNTRIVEEDIQLIIFGIEIIGEFLH